MHMSGDTELSSNTWTVFVLVKQCQAIVSHCKAHQSKVENCISKVWCDSETVSETLVPGRQCLSLLAFDLFLGCTGLQDLEI